MNLFLSSLVILEIFIAILGTFSILRKKHYTIAESFCFSTILILTIYSLSIQLFFLARIHQYYYLFDIGILSFSSFQIWKNKKIIFSSFEVFVQSSIWQTNKFISFILIFISSYLFLQSFLLPPSNWDALTYNLARVLMFQEEGSLFLKNFSTYRQVMHPWGYDILSFLFLRFYSDYGLAVFSFLSYIVVIAGTYALVRKIFNNANLSLTTSFIIASLTGLILQAVTTKNDIPMAAVVVVCFLAAYNFYSTKKYFDFYIIVVAILFGLSVKSYFLGFLVPFLFFYALLLMNSIKRRNNISRKAAKGAKYAKFYRLFTVQFTLRSWLPLSRVLGKKQKGFFGVVSTLFVSTLLQNKFTGQCKRKSTIVKEILHSDHPGEVREKRNTVFSTTFSACIS